jgi:hypothetical protein
MEEHQPPPTPVREQETVYIYRYDPVTSLPVIVGKVFIDENADAWVKINETDLAKGIGVMNIDGVAMVSAAEFNAQEPA